MHEIKRCCRCVTQTPTRINIQSKECVSCFSEQTQISGMPFLTFLCFSFIFTHKAEQ